MNDHTLGPVTRNDDASRYEITVDNNLAGIVEYDETDGRITMTHTEVFAEYRHGGAAGALAGGAIIDAVERGLTIIPTCPYIAAYLRKHPIAHATIDWPSAT